MKPEDLITDKAIEIVFSGTNFGNTTPKEIISEDLQKVVDGWAIGHTAQCCLQELGLIYMKSNKDFYPTRIGKEYLKTLTQKDTWYNESETNERMNIIGQNGNDGEHYENNKEN